MGSCPPAAGVVDFVGPALQRGIRPVQRRQIKLGYGFLHIMAMASASSVQDLERREASLAMTVFARRSMHLMMLLADDCVRH